MNEALQTVYLIDDDDNLRRSLVRLLDCAGVPCAPHASAAEFLRQIDALGPGCLLLDLRMPGMDGLELQAELRRREIHLPIIFLTANGDVPASVKAMKGGAVDFLTKPVQPPQLLAAIGSALTIEKEMRGRRAEIKRIRALLERLTPREWEVLMLVVQGLLNKQIGAELGAAEKTIKIHRAHVMEKMEAPSLAALVSMVERVGGVEELQRLRPVGVNP